MAAAELGSFSKSESPAMSWYLTIRADASYSRFAATVPLVEFLAAMPELRQTSPAAFQAADGQSRVTIMLAACDSAGSYASDGASLPKFNVVELICSSFGDPAWYDALAGRIAAFLGWSVFEDHEARQVWPPIGPTQAEPAPAELRSSSGNSRPQPPQHIDGALVLEWAWSDLPFGVVPFSDGRIAADIHGLALCRYDRSSDVYRFSCDAQWQCQQDQVYDSVVTAKAQLPDQYRGAPIHWHQLTDTALPRT